MRFIDWQDTLINNKAEREIIPDRVFRKKPSPELREEQYDPFDFSIVSPMVDDMIERGKSKRELIEMGYPKGVVEDIYTRFKKAEYKRRQAPPCIRSPLKHSAWDGKCQLLTNGEDNKHFIDGSKILIMDEAQKRRNFLLLKRGLKSQSLF